jgi:uncharacterized protein YggE
MFRPSPLIAALLVAAPAAALAQPPRPVSAPAALEGPVVTLSVSESIDAPPDLAVIQTGVETRAPAARDAMAQNARKIDALVAALLKTGIQRQDIQTGRISLNPQYDYSDRSGEQGPRFLGYQATNMLTVTLRKLDNAGETIDAMVNAGATNINGPTFSIADTSKIEAQARDRAVRNGAERAAAYARAAGYRSARLLAISETGGFQPPMPLPMARAMSLADAPATKIEPGQLSTSVTLNFSYMLER